MKEIIWKLLILIKECSTNNKINLTQNINKAIIDNYQIIFEIFNFYNKLIKSISSFNHYINFSKI